MNYTMAEKINQIKMDIVKCFTVLTLCHKYLENKKVLGFLLKVAKVDILRKVVSFLF